MTPTLEAAYDALLTRANEPPFRDVARSLKKDFGARCGWYEVDHPGSEAREAAAWEDALARGGLARMIASELRETELGQLAWAVERAHHGVFVFERGAPGVLACDLWSGAEFVLARTDALVHSLPAEHVGEDSPLCQGRLIGTPDGCVLLPGMVFHPTDARSALSRVLHVARERRMSRDDTLDALLRMEHTFHTLSRIKIAFAYRPEAL